MVSSDVEHFRHFIQDFETAMLVTHSRDERMHARPMAVVQIEENCDLWFMTSTESEKFAEMGVHSDVLVTFQNEETSYITILGEAQLVRDRQKIEALWRDTYKIWFPAGRNDPNLTLVKVQVQSGEYWDHKGIYKAKYSFERGKASKAKQPNQQPQAK